MFNRMRLIALAMLVAAPGTALAGDETSVASYVREDSGLEEILHRIGGMTLTLIPAAPRDLSRASLVVGDGAIMRFVWTREAHRFVEQLDHYRAAGKVQFDERDPAKGVRRVELLSEDNRTHIFEYWMDTRGTMRLVLAMADTKARASELVEIVEGARADGLYGGPAQLHGPSPAPDGPQ